ncbi:MAG TPA: ATP-binding protein [Gammaproteobacteria bacterium]|jgi:signal transduction histidine kinase|nr:ATP-binding protein [Gammaproteobacteria bacterium]
MPAEQTDSGPVASAGSLIRRHLLLLGAGLIALIMAADVHEAWQDYRASLERSRQAAELLSHAFGDQTARMIQELDFALADYAEWAQPRTVEAAGREPLTRQLLTHVARLPYVYSAAVIDAAGRRIATTDDSSPDVETPATFPSFEILQNAETNTMHIGRPFTSRRDGYRTFALSRRLTDADGQFAGIVLARVSFDYLARFYEAINVSPGAEIRLARSDGVVLALYPSGREDFLADRDASYVTAKSPVGTYPLEIEVGQSYHDALAGWRQQELFSAARTGTLALLAATLLGAIMVTLRRREQAELARRESEAQLQDARRAEAVSLLAASVAHDFNNVLGAIVGYAELAREAGTESEQRSSIDRLLGAAERARQLVRRVLTLDPHRSVRDRTVIVAPIVREVVDQLQTHSARALGFDVRVDDESLAVSGDSTEIYQVLLNLCTNALQATPANGRVTIHLRGVTRDAPQELTVGRVAAGDYVAVTITDEGPGIDGDRAQRMFDPLQTTKHPGQGIGIGLTVVRTIVERMRGAIEVGAAPTRGASFTVYWPRHAAGAAELQAPAAENAVRTGSGQVVMIVDDEPQLASLLEDMAASLGYEPLGLTDPARALDLLRRTPDRIDVLITDERMPGMRGMDLARSVRELRPDLPIVLVTGYRSAELDGEAGRCGIARILDKPVHRSELERALGELVP